MKIELGLIKNLSEAPAIWGRYEVAPHSIGRIPIEAIEGLRRHPSRDFIVVEDDPNLCPFVRTEHEPFSPRYRETG